MTLAPPARRLAAALAILSLHGGVAIHWPGLRPTSYLPGDLVPMRVNKLTSVHTQVPYSYDSLPFCRPHRVLHAAENLGEVLYGSVIENAPFVLRFGKTDLKVLCRVEMGAEERKVWTQRIREEYRGHLLLDNLPVATRLSNAASSASRPAGRSTGVHYERGYRVGFIGGREAPESVPGRAYVHNHFEFAVSYYPTEGGGGRIVGFELRPASVQYTHSRKWPDDFEGADHQAKEPLNLLPEAVGLKAVGGALAVDDIGGIGGGGGCIFTYNATWAPSAVPYSSRWDLFLYMAEGESVHWFSLTGSLAISLLLAGLVAAIMARTVRRDLQRYNALDETDELLHEVGWKYCHTDVLRPPPRPLALAVCVGGGVQLLCMTAVSILVAALGLLSPTSRGRLLTATLLLFTAAGLPAGYAAAWVYRQMHGRQPYTLIVAAACAFPGAFFALFLLLDTVLWAAGSSSAVPFGTMLLLLLMWLCLDGPLVVCGAWMGFKAPQWEEPVYTNAIPRQIPSQPLLATPLATALLGGLLPFGSASIELAIVVSSVWMQRIYFVFGFLLLMVLMMGVICAEVGIVMAYLQLCREDYRWWWRAFANTASAGGYLFVYAIVYARSELQLHGAAAPVLYYGYMGAASLGVALMTGTVGFAAAYAFVYHIYAAVKVD